MDKNNIIGAPILIIAFNRPEVSNQTFEYIRNARPSKLYIAIDGPRQNIEGEDLLVNKVKTILENVNWPCGVYYKYNEINKGAEITVSSAINWVFETEEYAIILEDDIVAPLAFLQFAEEMLLKYKDEHIVATVTGSNFSPIPIPNNSDYFFAKYGHSWGWATWKRAWQDFDLNVVVPKEHLELKFLKTITNSIKEAKYYQKKFLEINKRGRGNSTWDYIGLYQHRIKNALSIIPRVNLTSNIGVVGLHARGETEHHFRTTDDSFVVINHPQKVDCFIKYDKLHFKMYINQKKSILTRVIIKVKRTLKL